MKPSDEPFPDRGPEFTYIYRRQQWLLLFRGIDAIGCLFHKPKLGIPDLSGARHIQVLKFDQIGDLLLTQPLLVALGEAAPRARVDLIVGRDRSHVAKAFGERDIYEWPVRLPAHSAPRFSGIGVLREMLRARKRKPDVIVAAKEDPFTVFAAWVIGSPVRIGFREGGLGFLLTHTIAVAPGQPQHRVLAKLAGPKGEGVGPPVYPITEQDEAALSSVLSLVRFSLALPLVIVHPGAGSPTKCWSWENFMAAMSAVSRERPVSFVVIRGPEDEVARVPEGSVHQGSWINVLPAPLELGTLAALLARADLFFGNDSAPAHLARAVGTPSVVAFLTDADPERWAPSAAESTVLLPDKLTPEIAASALIEQLDRAKVWRRSTSQPGPSGQ